MGQTVVVNNLVPLDDDLLLIDTDRSFTGQDGVVLTPSEPGNAVPGRLARALFDLDLGIDHIFVLQNTVTVRRGDGWDDAATQAVRDAVASFLRFYGEVASSK